MVFSPKIAANLLNLVFPPRCFSCNMLTAEQGSLCATCWNDVDFIAAPLCHRCGTPFEHDIGAESECITCLNSQPPYVSARSVFRYEGGSRRLVTGYKYYDRTWATPMFGRWLARAGAEQLVAADCVVPVPLHRWRLLRRRYNQSALLAAELAKCSGRRFYPDALRRTRHTEQQAGLTREERERNVADAFAVPDKRQADIAGKAVLLVDDVLTTGATLHACTEALLAAGAKTVYILTLARTTLDDV